MRCVGILVAAIALAGCPSGNSRDVVPVARDVRLGPEGGAATPPTSPDGYAYVAKRARASLGLVGSRNMKEEDARRALDRIADDLDACAARLEKRGALVDGAVQLVALGNDRGTAEITDVRLAPGGPVAANALECIIAPLRASSLAPNATLAIEATWGPVYGTVDGGGGGVGGGL